VSEADGYQFNWGAYIILGKLELISQDGKMRQEISGENLNSQD